MNVGMDESVEAGPRWLENGDAGDPPEQLAPDDTVLRRALDVDGQRSIPAFIRIVLMAVAMSAAMLSVAYAVFAPELFKQPLLVALPIGVPALIALFVSMIEQSTLRRLAREHHKLVDEMQRRAEAEEELKRLALTDDLTGVANRRQFFMLAKKAIERSRRYHSPVAVAIMDIDRFKLVNDRYGHDVGDRVIVGVAEAALGIVRGADSVARLGGEEFGILLEQAGPDTALEIAERLRSAVCELRVECPAGEPVRVTVSLGVDPMKIGESDIDAALKRADDALYKAKRGGRNRVVMSEAAA